MCELHLNKRKRVLCSGCRTLSNSISYTPGLLTTASPCNSPSDTVTASPFPPLHPRAGPVAPQGVAHTARSTQYKEGGKVKAVSPQSKLQRSQARIQHLLSNYRQKRFQGNVPAVGGTRGPQCQPQRGTPGCPHATVTLAGQPAACKE